jgi:hypothetical protein
MNESQLEAIIQQQRLELFFRWRFWLEEREENARLRNELLRQREVILTLQIRLAKAGLDFEVPVEPDLNLQPLLPFMEEVT